MQSKFPNDDALKSPMQHSTYAPSKSISLEFVQYVTNCYFAE